MASPNPRTAKAASDRAQADYKDGYDHQFNRPVTESKMNTGPNSGGPDPRKPNDRVGNYKRGMTDGANSAVSISEDLDRINSSDTSPSHANAHKVIGR